MIVPAQDAGPRPESSGLDDPLTDAVVVLAVAMAGAAGAAGRSH
ncbi:hypothetical protein [Amycolatopsis sp. NPDC054798]